MSLDAAAFATLMAPLGPFEPAPRLAVGVSGGADSLALVLLADAWARERGGSVTALTVDHGLRPEAAEEAARVGAWMAAHGIAHVILRGAGPPPGRNLQAEARALRHGLLRDWCQRAGVLHLLLAHNLEDQAETLLLRLARGSGAGGLAAMAAVSWTPEARILRPLLSVPRADLESVLRERGLDWVRDPSNANEAFGRVRMRRLLPALAAEGAEPARLAATARRLGAGRQVLDDAVADLLAVAVAPHPAGFVWLEAGALRAAPEEIALRALRGVLACVGGRPYGPRAERAAAVLSDLGTRPFTLGGCRALPQGDGRLLVVREARALPEADIAPGGVVPWDGRFRLRLSDRASAPGRIRALGVAGWAQVRDRGLLQGLPGPARLTLPALWRGGEVACVPAVEPGARSEEVAADWRPRHVLVSGGFRLAAAPSSII